MVQPATPLPPSPPPNPRAPLGLADLYERLGELLRLETGWFDGQGEPLSPKALSYLGEFFVRLFWRAKLPIPYLYPSPSGEVHAEWDLGRWAVSASVDLGTLRAYLHASHLDSDETREEEISLGEDAGEQKLVAFVRGCA